MKSYGTLVGDCGIVLLCYLCAADCRGDNQLFQFFLPPLTVCVSLLVERHHAGARSPANDDGLVKHVAGGVV